MDGKKMHRDKKEHHRSQEEATLPEKKKRPKTNEKQHLDRHKRIFQYPPLPPTSVSLLFFCTYQLFFSFTSQHFSAASQELDLYWFSVGKRLG
jgi:hypothetical protein